MRYVLVALVCVWFMLEWVSAAYHTGNKAGLRSCLAVYEELEAIKAQVAKSDSVCVLISGSCLWYTKGELP